MVVNEAYLYSKSESFLNLIYIKCGRHLSHYHRSRGLGISVRIMLRRRNYDEVS